VTVAGKSVVKVGRKAPGFRLQDDTGAWVSLDDFAGRRVVLFFFPKAATPGCTVEACEFRDEYKVLQKKDAVVLGVSPDGAKSHEKFIAKFSLPFPLLVDEEHTLAGAYGAWGEKSLYGRKFMGLIRSTALIGPDGTVVKHWPKVKAKGHAAEVIAAIDAHQKG
jgi:peroxiredoxin Q/BCP